MPRPGSEPVELDIEVRRQASQAALCYFEDADKEVWVPYSVIHEDCAIDLADLEEGDEATILVQEWFAEKEELE